MMRAVTKYPIAVVLITAACGSEPATPADPDAPPGDPIDAADDSPDGPPGDWVEPYLREIVQTLAQGPRASVAQRNATRDYLVAELEALGLAPDLHTSDTGANVIARIEPTVGGADTPAIVLGAHVDGVPQGPAAADNATGTALVVALGRWLRDLPVRDRPVILALFDQEEVGLIGSTRYADQLLADETAVAAVHNFDMLSYDGDGDHAVELWSPSPTLEAAYRAAAEPLGIPISAVDFEFSDHQSFLDEGFTTVGVSEEFVGGDSTDHYHQASDTYANVDFAHLRRVTGLAMAVLEAELQ